jgi:hypothetical protein
MIVAAIDSSTRCNSAGADAPTPLLNTLSSPETTAWLEQPNEAVRPL